MARLILFDHLCHQIFQPQFVFLQLFFLNILFGAEKTLFFKMSNSFVQFAMFFINSSEFLILIFQNLSGVFERYGYR